MARDVQVPDEIAARLDALLSAFARDLAIAKAQTAAAKASDAPAFKATLPRVDAQAVVKDAADELGITCQY